MGIRDDLRKSLGSGLGAASDWIDNRRDERRLSEFDDRINKAAKAARADGNGGNHELKVGKDEAPIREPKAIHFDPFDMVAAMGYRERPSALTFTAMEMIGRGTPVIADIIGTRVKQVSMFCDIPEDRHSPGFRVRSRDWRNKTPTKAMKKESERLERLLAVQRKTRAGGWFDSHRYARCWFDDSERAALASRLAARIRHDHSRRFAHVRSGLL